MSDGIQSVLKKFLVEIHHSLTGVNDNAELLSIALTGQIKLLLKITVNTGQ
jgi:hypothetical protein